MSGELWLFGFFINTVLEVYFLPLLPYNPKSALALYYVCSGHPVLHYISPKKDVSWQHTAHNDQRSRWQAAAEKASAKQQSRKLSEFYSKICFEHKY